MIVLPEGLARAVREHARGAYPEECCGGLLGVREGERDIVTEVEPLENAEPEARRRRYRIAPEEYRRLERLAEEKGRLLLGFYHSHPDHPAAPSERDREQALPFFHYLVLSVSSGEPGEMTSWVLSEDRGVFGRETLLPAATEA